MINEPPPSSGWVPLWVPAELAPDVLRSVASFLEPGRSGTGPSDWSVATSDDIAEFLQGVEPLEWRLISELARHEGPSTVAGLAEALRVEMGAVAGAMGPVNKRAKRRGWAPPIEPRRFTPPGESASRRGLVLTSVLREWINSRGDGQPSLIRPTTGGPR